MENALQIQCVRKIKADCVLTRDDKLKKLVKEAITPLEFVYKFLEN